jgi:hypothetical protein
MGCHRDKAQYMRPGTNSYSKDFVQHSYLQLWILRPKHDGEKRLKTES